METCHGHGGYGTWTKDIHFFVEAVIDYEIVCHTDTVGFHGMALAVVVVAYFGVVEVGDATAASATAADDAAATSASANTAASARGGGDAWGRGGRWRRARDGHAGGAGRRRRAGGGGSGSASGAGR